MKIFLTGATGFVGCNFLNLLHSENPNVSIKALRRPKSKCRIALASEPEWIEASLGELEEKHFVDCDVFIHFAAAGVLPQQANWEDCFRVNVTDSISAWRKACRQGVTRFLICGSCFEYGRSAERYDFIPPTAPLEPTGSYHASKAAASMAAIAFAAESKIEVAVFRPFHIFGEGEAITRFWPSLRDAAKSGQDFPMTLGEQVRDFTPVEVVARKFQHGLFRTDLRPGICTIENIGTGNPQRLRDFARDWWQRWQAKGQLRFGAVEYRPDEVMRYVPQL